MLDLIVFAGRGLRGQKGLHQLLRSGGKAGGWKKGVSGGPERWCCLCGVLKEPRQDSKMFASIPQPLSGGHTAGEWPAQQASPSACGGPDYRPLSTQL